MRNRYICADCKNEFFSFTASHWCERCRRKVLRDIAEYPKKKYIGKGTNVSTKESEENNG